MQRLLTRFLLVVLAILAIGAQMVAAAPTAQGRYGTLESLATYFPKDSMLYTALRTDAQTISTLDNLMQSVTSQLPSNALPPDFPSTLTAALSLITGQATGGSFESTVRPWLGDVLAVGIYPARESAAGRIVIQIRSPQAAIAAVQTAFPNWQRQNLTDFVVFSSTTDRNRVAIYQDVIILYSWSDPSGPQQFHAVIPDISANPYYRAALARLPENNYSIISFIDSPLMLAYNERNNDDGSGPLRAALYRAIGPTAIGFTVLEGNTLTVDVAQAVGNRAGLDALGITFPGDGASLNPAILERVPRDAVMVFHAADPGALLDAVGGNVQAVGKKFQTVLPSLTTAFIYSMSVSSVGTLSALTAGLNNPDWATILFNNLSGFDYTSEIRPLLAGDGALYLSFNPAYDRTSPRFVNREPLDGALLLRVNDPAAAQTFMQKLARELAITAYSMGDRYTLDIRETTLAGGATGIVLDIYGSTGQPLNQFVVAGADDLLVIGTPQAANRVFSRDGVGFSVNTVTLLPNSGMALYLNTTPMVSAPAWTDFNESDPGNPLLQLLPFLMDNLTLSLAGTADDDLLLRTTVTLPCGDDCG
ncbi:MAG: hypothetical protein R3E39_19485 [Anaerolineae bacterium]